MKKKHLDVRIKQTLLLASLSSCPRKQFGALLLDPIRNVVLADSYNGAPRGGGTLCGGTRCLRNEENIKSGERAEIGCHHAEMNLICNAAANGIATQNSWLIVNGEPCMMCAKLIHHAGIAKVIIVEGGYGLTQGVEYLNNYQIEVEKYNV